MENYTIKYQSKKMTITISGDSIFFEKIKSNIEKIFNEVELSNNNLIKVDIFAELCNTQISLFITLVVYHSNLKEHLYITEHFYNNIDELSNLLISILEKTKKLTNLKAEKRVTNDFIAIPIDIMRIITSTLYSKKIIYQKIPSICIHRENDEKFDYLLQPSSFLKGDQIIYSNLPEISNIESSNYGKLLMKNYASIFNIYYDFIYFNAYVVSDDSISIINKTYSFSDFVKRLVFISKDKIEIYLSLENN